MLEHLIIQQQANYMSRLIPGKQTGDINYQYEHMIIHHAHHARALSTSLASINQIMVINTINLQPILKQKLIRLSQEQMPYQPCAHH